MKIPYHPIVLLSSVVIVLIATSILAYHNNHSSLFSDILGFIKDPTGNIQIDPSLLFTTKEGDIRGDKVVTDENVTMSPRLSPMSLLLSPYNSVSPSLSPTKQSTGYTISLITPSTLPKTNSLTATNSPTLSPTPSVTLSLLPTVTPMPSSTPTPTMSSTPLPETTPDQIPAYGSVIISEIAWSGTKASQYAEWIELYNTTNNDIDLADWSLFESNGSVKIIDLYGSIPAHGYFLVERVTPSSPDAVTGIQDIAGQFGGSGLSNTYENIRLVFNPDSAIIDETPLCSDSNENPKWCAGTGSPAYSSMERKDPLMPGIDSANWQTNDGTIINGSDADGNPIHGTPRAKNSATP